VQIPPFAGVYPDIHKRRLQEYFLRKQQAGDNAVGRSLPENRVDTFILCFSNRCGSNFIAQAIASDGRLNAPGENLNFDVVIRHSDQRAFTSFLEYWQWLTNAAKSDLGLFGCKASAGQLLFLCEEGVLKRDRVRFIHVLRRSTIDQAVSLFIASKTKKWTSTQVGMEVDIQYSPDELVSIIQNINLQNAAFNTIFQLLNVQPLVMYYEDFVEDPENGVKTIGSFLGVDDLRYVPHRVAYAKQADHRNKELVQKFVNEFALR
jgi:LPS sulfotransferase NodH